MRDNIGVIWSKRKKKTAYRKRKTFQFSVKTQNRNRMINTMIKMSTDTQNIYAHKAKQMSPVSFITTQQVSPQNAIQTNNDVVILLNDGCQSLSNTTEFSCPVLIENLLPKQLLSVHPKASMVICVTMTQNPVLGLQSLAIFPVISHPLTHFIFCMQTH